MVVPSSVSVQLIEGTHREKATSNKTAALAKNTNMSIFIVDTTNQLFKRGS